MTAQSSIQTFHSLTARKSKIENRKSKIENRKSTNKPLSPTQQQPHKLKMTDGKVIIHAEGLAYLAQISVSISLPSPSDKSTAARIEPGSGKPGSKPGSWLIVDHADAETRLLLPALVMQDVAVPPISRGRTSLSFRLPVSSGLPPPDSPRSEHQPVPWTALDITPLSGVTCRKCGRDVVPSFTITEWKNLPSENWAEMMDYWHCHKPVVAYESDHQHDGCDKNLPSKAYGAANVIAAQRTVGFVDLLSFMFHKEDCHIDASEVRGLFVCTSKFQAELLAGAIRRWPSRRVIRHQWHGHRYNARKKKPKSHRRCG